MTTEHDTINRLIIDVADLYLAIFDALWWLDTSESSDAEAIAKVRTILNAVPPPSDAIRAIMDTRAK